MKQSFSHCLIFWGTSHDEDYEVGSMCIVYLGSSPASNSMSSAALVRHGSSIQWIF